MYPNREPLANCTSRWTSHFCVAHNNRHNKQSIMQWFTCKQLSLLSLSLVTLVLHSPIFCTPFNPSSKACISTTCAIPLLLTCQLRTTNP